MLARQLQCTMSMNNNNNNNGVTFSMRCRAFSCEGMMDNEIKVEQDGTVHVWDDIAGYFTNVHSMSKYAEKKARKIAKEIAREIAEKMM